MPWHHWKAKSANQNDLATAVVSPASLSAAALSLHLPDVKTPPSADSALPNIQSTNSPVDNTRTTPAQVNGPEDGESSSSDSYMTASCQGSEKEWEHLEIVREEETEPLSELGLDVPPPVGATTTDSYLQPPNSPHATLDLSTRPGSAMSNTPSSSSSEITPRLSPSRTLTMADGRPLVPPNILKEELRFEIRLFDGIYSDVYLAEWKGQLVAVKVLRRLSLSAEAMDRKRRRELSTWWELVHPSILPLLGFVEDIQPTGALGAMISPYCQHGDALTYLANTPSNYQTKITLWYHVIEGIQFLHNYQPVVVHGDLKPANIVIDDALHARICDFGLSRLTLDHGHTGLTTTTAYTGTTRYKPKELVQDPRANPTTASDIYALGCLGLEFVLDRQPYAHLNDSMWIEEAIKRGDLPAERPNKLAEDAEVTRLWSQLEECWDFFPEDRPPAAAVGEYVLDRWEGLARELEGGEMG